MDICYNNKVCQLRGLIEKIAVQLLKHAHRKHRNERPRCCGAKGKMRMKRIFAVALAALLLCTMLGGCAGKPFRQTAPQKVMVWHYYNGPQKQAFAALVEEFNTTEGMKKGIVVEESSQASVAELEQSVMDAAEKKVGASELPNIFAAYADTAYAVDQMGLLADFAPMLSPEEQSAYLDSYLDEGRFGGAEKLKIFPVAKATEIFMLNQTDWAPFAQATGAMPDDFATMEGLVKTAQAYYEWTDARTPEIANDGEAFYGRDALANYMLIGARQLGVELLAVQDGKPVLNWNQSIIKTLWDHYYVPFVKGYFSAENRFRSDDVKVGNIIAFTGSSSGATFFPTERIVSDEESYPVEMEVFPAPQFASGEAVAVQQGAGMVITNGDEAAVQASLTFLKWFTQPERNLVFSLDSGYLPVTKEANNPAFVAAGMEKNGTPPQMRKIVEMAIATTNGNLLYTTTAFEGGSKARNILEYAMADKAAADRAAVQAALEAGESLEEAAAPYMEKSNFENWYAETKQALEASIAGE